MTRECPQLLAHRDRYTDTVNDHSVTRKGEHGYWGLESGGLVHAYNPSTHEAEAGGSKSLDSLGYTVNSRQHELWESFKNYLVRTSKMAQ